jgi:hypothetical protein
MKPAFRLFIFSLTILLVTSCNQRPKPVTPAAPTSAVDSAGANPEAPEDTGGDIRDKIANEITDNLSKEDYADARKDFAQIMIDGLPERKLKEAWEMVQKQLGTYQKVISTTEEEKNGLKIIKKRCQFGSENATIQIAFNQENKVVGLFFLP